MIDDYAAARAGEQTMGEGCVSSRNLESAVSHVERSRLWSGSSHVTDRFANDVNLVGLRAMAPG